jgi:hypothetical protein
MRRFVALAVLAAVSTGAFAVPVTWDLRGTITQSSTAGIISTTLPTLSDVSTGEAFNVLLSFDTEAALLNAQSGGRFAPGVRYEFDPSSIRYTVGIGARAPLDFVVERPFPDSLLFMRDNSGDIPGEGAQVDGFTFGLGTASGIGMSSVMRGTVLDIVMGSMLPEMPDPRLADLGLSLFQIFSLDFDDLGQILGDIESVRVATVSVSEPAPLALFGIGLAALFLVRRRLAG